MRQFSLIDIFDNVLPSLRYDLREEQEYMARFVETAIRTKKVLLAEAGVGTGKTFAYLIPALLHYNFQTDMLKHIMIISTNTIILQNQLIEDIYRIIDILKLDLDPEKLVLAKGKNNFVCPERGLRNKELISKEILEWALSTKTGDRNELLECSDKTWQLININEESDCSHCNNNNHCYYVNLRNRWKTARIIVTNHQQLLADAINRESSPSMPLFCLPSIIIIDEAHRFEDAALQMLSTSFCFNDIKILPRLVKNLEQQLMYILKGTAKLEQLGDDLIDGLKKAIEWDDEESGRAFVKKNDSLHYLIEQYLDIMQSVSEGLTLASTERYKNRQLDMIMDRLPETLEAIISPQKYVCWAEIKNYRIHNFAAISRDYPHKLYELLWKEKRPIVFTSATMTGVNPKDYSYLIETLGINDHIAMKAVASPFDLKKQRIVYLPIMYP